MKFSVNVDPALLSAIDERAGAASVCRADWVRAALSEAVNPEESTENPDVLRLQASLLEVETDRDRLAALVAARDQAIAELTIERDQARTAAADLERARADLTARDHALVEKAEEINWLRGEVSKLNDKLTPAMIPETTGTGRRPWWAIWRRAD